MPDFDDEIVAARCVTAERVHVDELTAPTLLTVFVLAVFVGFEVISKVSSVLHTPLMSGANAIHGVILVGAIIVDRPRALDARSCVLGLLAVVLPRSTWSAASSSPTGCWRCSAAADKPARARTTRRVNVLSPTPEALGYLVAAVCFILALKGLSSPAHRARAAT